MLFSEDTLMTLCHYHRGVPCRRAHIFAPGVLSILACTCLSAPLLAARIPQAHASRVEDSRALASFVGTWQASYGGKVFAILVLREDHGTIAGTLNNFDLALDPKGNLADGTHADSGDSPLFNLQLEDGALYFIAVQKDAYHPSTSWKFVPRNAREADLTPLFDNDPQTPAMTSVKPIRMTRELSRR